MKIISYLLACLSMFYLYMLLIPFINDISAIDFIQRNNSEVFSISWVIALSVMTYRVKQKGEGEFFLSFVTLPYLLLISLEELFPPAILTKHTLYAIYLLAGVLVTHHLYAFFFKYIENKTDPIRRAWRNLSEKLFPRPEPDDDFEHSGSYDASYYTCYHCGRPGGSCICTHEENMRRAEEHNRQRNHQSDTYEDPEKEEARRQEELRRQRIYYESYHSFGEKVAATIKDGSSRPAARINRVLACLLSPILIPVSVLLTAISCTLLLCLSLPSVLLYYLWIFFEELFITQQIKSIDAFLGNVLDIPYFILFVFPPLFLYDCIKAMYYNIRSIFKTGTLFLYLDLRKAHIASNGFHRRFTLWNIW